MLFSVESDVFFPFHLNNGKFYDIILIISKNRTPFLQTKRALQDGFEENNDDEKERRLT